MRSRWAFKQKPMSNSIKVKILEMRECTKKSKDMKKKNRADHQNQNSEDCQRPKQPSSVISPTVATSLQVKGFKLSSNEISQIFRK